MAVRQNHEQSPMGDVAPPPASGPGARLGREATDWLARSRLLLAWWWWRRLRAPTLALLFGIFVALIIAELAIRAVPDSAIPTRIGNIMFTCHEGAFPERYIYAHALPIDQAVHQPRLKTECYFNGYFWEHQSDAYGWRNPETWDRVELVLIGDSMIYGHGVEEHQTAAHFLRQSLGVRVANHGMIGACPLDYLAVYRNFSLPLRPKVTVAFVFANDISDLHGQPADKLDGFAETGQLAQARRYRRSDLLNTLSYPEVSTVQRWAGRSRLYSLLRYHLPALRATPRSHGGPGTLPPLSGPDPAAELAGTDYRGAPRDWYGLEMGFLRRVVATMAASARAQDTVLVLAYLPGQDPYFLQEDVRVPAHLERFAKESGVLFFWAGGALANKEGTGQRPGTRLPGDIHLTELGHRLLAQDLERFLRRHVPALAGKPQ